MNTTQGTAEHYSSTTLHYYCALQSATPVLLCSATPVALRKWSEWERRGAGTLALPSAGVPALWEEAPHVQEAATDCARTRGQQSWAGTRAHDLPPAKQGVIPLHQLPPEP